MNASWTKIAFVLCVACTSVFGIRSFFEVRDTPLPQQAQAQDSASVENLNSAIHNFVGLFQ